MVACRVSASTASRDRGGGRAPAAEHALGGGGPPRDVGDPAPGEAHVADGAVGRRGPAPAAAETSAKAYDARSRALHVRRAPCQVGGRQLDVGDQLAGASVVSVSGWWPGRRWSSPIARGARPRGPAPRRPRRARPGRPRGRRVGGHAGLGRAEDRVCSGRSPPARSSPTRARACCTAWSRRRSRRSACAAGGCRRWSPCGGSGPTAPASSARLTPGNPLRTSGWRRGRCCARWRRSAARRRVRRRGCSRRRSGAGR